MEDRNRKTNIRKQDKAVPVMVWMATGVLFLAVILLAHALPDPKTAEAIEYFNIQRLDRFRAQPSPRPPRVIVVGSSLSMSALYFDEEMERFARENGLPDVNFIRFIKLDSGIEDFTPLLNSILDAAPDVVIFESRLFTMKNKLQDRKLKATRFFKKNERQDDGIDDRKKLKLYVTEHFTQKKPQQKKDNPNVPVSENKLLETLRQRQAQRDLWQYQDMMEELLITRPFSVPDAYKRFFDMLRQKQIAAILLDTPPSEHETTLYAREIREEIPELIRRYQEACGLQYRAYPGKLGLEYYKDYRHMNERGRDAYSRWFLSEIPALVKKEKSL